MRGIALAVAMLAGAAQADDRDILTAFLEDNLSGAGRVVIVTGFTGALSSKAKIAELTIADAEGIWLTLRDVTLDWNRSALFSGVVSVNELTAAEIVLDRIPVTDTAGIGAEAWGFALPELPVSVDIGLIEAGHIVLGAAVLGETVEGSFSAGMALTGGEGRANLLLERTDAGPAGKISLTASYSNANRQLVLDLSAVEAAKGIAVRLLGIPGAPSAELTIAGSGPVERFAASVGLVTDGVTRLAGDIQLSGDGTGQNGFTADLAGDLAPLFLPAYAEFFGPEVRLTATGSRSADGAVALSALDLSAQAITLRGQIALAADGLPQSFDVRGHLGLADGTPLLLPLTTDQATRITGADIALRFDAAKDDGWSGEVVLQGLNRADFAAREVSLSGSGRIARLPTGTVVGATLDFAAKGLAPANPDLGTALGQEVTGQAIAHWQEGTGGLSLAQLKLAGQDYAFSMRGRISGQSEGFALTGQIEAQIDDLRRMAGLAGQPIAGRASLTLRGNGSPLSGAFDLQGTVQGENLQSGVAELDGLLRGISSIDVSARRDETGTMLRNLKLVATSLTATAQGKIASTGSDLSADLAFADVSVLGGPYRGAMAGTARMAGTLSDGRLTIEAAGSGLGVGQAEVDKIIGGPSQVRAVLGLTPQGVLIRTFDLTTPQIVASATGRVDGTTRALSLTARLRDLALIYPEFPGAITATGSARQDGLGTVLDLRVVGPAQIAASVSGRVSPDFATADLAISGTAQGALANKLLAPRSLSGPLRFDLLMKGPFALSSLIGPVTLAGGQVSDPAQNFSLLQVTGRADLAGGRAQVGGTAEVSTGGRLALDGTVALEFPYATDAAVTLQQVTLRDPDLYETTGNGNLTVTGPLLGGALVAGRISLINTELRIPSTGLGGFGAVPELRHVQEPGDVYQTRVRAGLIATGEAVVAGSGTYRLDLQLSAPNQVFIRGRGLDAELGGTLTLTGTTANIIPSGSFALIRGRLDILGKRLNLSEALLQMQGPLEPYVRILASTQSDGIVVSVLIEGPATNPTVRFTSSPELPEEEVLARLLFDQGLQNLSALQAAQLAGAVASLAGSGSVGLLTRLRTGVGLDNLDLRTNDAGTAMVTAGKYLSSKLYTEITVDQDGKSQINLNLDLAPHITLRGRADSDGTTGLGVFLEKDF